MKKNLMYGLMSSALVLSIATACSDDNFGPGSGDGAIDLSVGLDCEALNASGVGRSRADGDITVSDLALTLTPNFGGSVRTWPSVDQFDSQEPIPVGDYTLSVSYGDLDTEGFGHPYYYGETNVKVRENETTPVSVTATLANSMVKVQTSEAFRNYFSEASFTIHSAGGDYIDYPLDETESAYFKPGQITIIANVTKPNGVGGSLEAASFTALPRYSYTVNVDINGGAGDAKLVITYNDETTEEVVEIDVTDELLNAPAPALTPEGFDPEATYTIIDGLPAGLNPELTVMARNGLAAVTMTTKSASLLALGWPAEIDLMQASESQQAALANLGLNVRGLYRNPDKMAFLDLKDVVNNIYYVKDAAQENSITFIVKDKLGKLSEIVALNVTTSPIEVSVGQPASPLPTFEPSLTVPVTYNGSNINNVSIYIKNNRGTFDKVENVTYAKTGDGTYTATFAVPADDKDVVIYAKCKDVTSSTVTIVREKIAFTLGVNSNNVFAKNAVLNIMANGATATNVPSSVKVQIATTGDFSNTTYTFLGNGLLRIDNLAPSTAYKARIFYNNEATAECSFTTEAATQLPNPGMESWYTSASGSNWSRQYPGTDESTVWGTNNPMTTSPGSNYAYRTISGTIQSGDAFAGSSAALIRTVAWGSNNNGRAPGGLISSTVQYVDAGLLHLGTSRSARPSDYTGISGNVNTDDLDCGLAFTSRPAALSFRYKYLPKNEADKGFAEIWVKDASGNTIAQKTVALDAATSYQQATLNLSYNANVAKGAKIYVRFQSTNDASLLNKGNDYITYPSSGLLTGPSASEGHIGSQLYVDDIELVY